MLLKKAGIPFAVVRSAHRERLLPRESPAENALRNAAGKARKARARGLILGADTLIAFRGKIIGKPKNRAEARRILKAFSGKTHAVLTAVALRNTSGGPLRSFIVKSSVTFRELGPEKIEAYLDTGEYKDKAGGYGFQEEGRKLVRRVRGSRTNVIGLPMERLKRELRKI